MEIKGKVLDENNEPLDLANVTIITGSEKNKFGTSTNQKGEFNLKNEIISSDSQFVISYMGYKSQNYKASELQGKTIKLEPDENTLGGLTIIKPAKVKQYLINHKQIFAGLGILLGISLIGISIKNIK